MVGSIIVSLLLALATGIFVNYWSEGIVGLPGNFDSNAYYEVVGTGKPCDSFTPVLLKRPDNSVRSVWFSGTVTNIPMVHFARLLEAEIMMGSTTIPLNRFIEE